MYLIFVADATGNVIFWIEYKDGSSSEQTEQINKQYAEYSQPIMPYSKVWINVKIDVKQAREEATWI